MSKISSADIKNAREYEQFTDRPAFEWVELGKYTKIEKCVCCGSDDLHPYLNLGYQPLANSYHKGQELPHYPLHLQVCKNCWHNMLTVSVDPKEMFENYLYISDTSKTLKTYFEMLTERVLSRHRGEEPPKVLEVACNSGMLLEMFYKRHCPCLGVDPAKNLLSLSKARGLYVIPTYWNMECAKNVKQDHLFDVVLAIHVLPHVPDPKEFLAACKDVLSENGKIYVQTSQCDMFRNGEFDATYHEHTSYFTAHSFKHLAESLGLKVTGAWKEPIHSMSFLFELSQMGEHCDELLAMVAEEDNRFWNTTFKYDQFAQRAEKTKHELVDLIDGFHKRGVKVVGYGAAAKGMTILSYADGLKLDYIVDDNNMKWDYLTPGTNIPIVSPQRLYNEKKEVFVLMLAWNFFDEIKERVRSNSKKKHTFVRYFPELTITI